MSQEHIPRPVKSAPEWVGEADHRRDVASLSDRGVAVMALNVALQLLNEFLSFRKGYDDDKTILLQELPNHEKRLSALEVGPHREEVPSSHEWNELLVKAGEELSKRVRDPHDRLDSTRAREIAKEVVQGAKTVSDANAFRALKSNGWKISLEVLKWVVGVAGGYIAARYGLHIGAP